MSISNRYQAAQLLLNVCFALFMPSKPMPSRVFST